MDIDSLACSAHPKYVVASIHSHRDRSLECHSSLEVFLITMLYLDVVSHPCSNRPFIEPAFALLFHIHKDSR